MTTTTQGTTTDLAQRVAEKGAAPLAVGKTIQQEIRELEPQFKAGLAGMIDPQRFMRIIFTELRNKPDLLECTRESVLGAVMQSAQLGLEFGPLQHAYLVPFRNHGTLECQFMIGYRGYIDLARRSGEVKDIVAVEVYQNDEFDFYRDENGDHLMHRPLLEGDRGAITHYYGRVIYTNGGNHVHAMTLADIDERRQRSATANSSRSPWKSDPIPMSRKTVIRALVPWLPLTTEVAERIGSDEAVVRYRPQQSEDLGIEFPDAVALESQVRQGVGAVKSDEREDAEEQMEALLTEAADRKQAERWLVATHGSLPNLDDAHLAAAIDGLKVWLDEPAEGASDAPTEESRSTGTVTPPVDAEARPVESEAKDKGKGKLDILAAEAVRLVTGMKGPQVKSTLAQFRTEDDPPVPIEVGGQKSLLITILERELRAENPAVRDLF